MLNYILVGLGSAMGGISRYWASGLVANRFGHSFPFGTLFVNVTGSFIIGFFATMTAPDGRWLVGPAGRNFFMSGFCGGYTTFSSLSLQTLNLAQDDEWLQAGGNAVLNVVLCLMAVWLGHVLAEILKPMKGI
ncbi:MAG: fluoride efflux transporter CrcB [Verrucomicrobia bacterium]|nr:fluoride efflux transporter CrcB [Verrucomicrobiota bacterium]MDE3099108.1 fluoride efflux transporter CrcB [Verrucomicrobiota bacterium]